MKSEFKLYSNTYCYYYIHAVDSEQIRSAKAPFDTRAARVLRSPECNLGLTVSLLWHGSGTVVVVLNIFILLKIIFDLVAQSNY
jgi:hypothetical protein